jgi:chemotaxis protein MotB
MRVSRWMAGGLVCGFALTLLGGCVSLDEHNRLKMAQRRLEAEKEQTEMDLFDARSVNNTLRARADSLEGELKTTKELVRNLRTEADLLDEIRETQQTTLEDMASRQTFGDITIAGPKLPEALDSALKDFAQQHADQVIYDPKRGTVKWKSDLLFALGSDVVKESSKNALQQFASVLNSAAASDFEVVVVGHTDTVRITPETQKKHPTNWHLSAHRSIAVAKVLIDSGYEPQRVAVVGCSEYRPVADNATEAGKSQNRRVEIYLVPVGTFSSRVG